MKPRFLATHRDLVNGPYPSTKKYMFSRSFIDKNSQIDSALKLRGKTQEKVTETLYSIFLAYSLYIFTITCIYPYSGDVKDPTNAKMSFCLGNNTTTYPI